MPAIDTDLFQVLALALLLLCLLALLAALSVLSGIKKRLESTPVSASEPAPSAYDYQPTPQATQEPAPSLAATPAPVQAQEVSTDFVPMTEAAPAATVATPVATSTGLRGDEPEEQPFERDGRWWFKRGGELLVYDEGTGQWVAAPSGGTGAATTVASAPAATQTTVTATTDAGEGWKCSSCGAVNGSTATSCRMCFAPR